MNVRADKVQYSKYSVIKKGSNKLWLTLFLLLLSFSSSISASKALTVTLNELNRGNVGDTWVNQTSGGAGTNYGAQAAMLVQSDKTTGASNNYRMLTLWNLSAIPAGSTITSANLYMVNSTPAVGRTYDAYNTSNSWSENSLNWNNQPAQGVFQDSKVISVSVGLKNWNVTNAAISQFSQSNKNMSIMIKDHKEDAANSGHPFKNSFFTKEFSTSSSRPRLVITYTPPTPPTFTSITPTSPNYPSTVSFSTVASPASPATTVALYVCKSNDGTSSGCGAGGTWCSSSSASNPSCSISTVLGAGTYNFYAYIFDNNNIAASNNPISGAFTVNKGSRTCSLLTDKGWSRSFDNSPSSTSCSVSSGSNDGSRAFTMNGSAVSSPDSRTNAGTYNYACQWAGGVNYSDCPQQLNTLTISKANPSFLTSASPVTYGTPSNYAGSESNVGDSGCAYALLRNNTQIGTGSSVLDSTALGAGAYNYTYYTDGCANYNSGKDERTLIVKKADTSVVLFLNGTLWAADVARGYPNATKVNATINVSSLQPSVTLLRNGTPAANPEEALLGLGVYNYTVVFAGNGNYTGSSMARMLAIADFTPPQKSINSPLNNSFVKGVVKITISASDALSGISSVQWKVDSSSWNTAAFNSTSGKYESSWDTAAVSDGSHTVSARANDTAGNVNEDPIVVFVDNTPPKVENSTLNKTIAQGTNQTVFVDASDGLSGVSSIKVEDYSEFLKFDFQPDSSPVQKDFIKVNRTMVYPSTSGGARFGWNATVFDDRERNTGTNLTRDFVFDSADKEFKVDLPNGTYNVIAFIGDMDYSHDMIDVFAEGQLKLKSLNNTAGAVNAHDFLVTVADGQLNMAMHEGGGTDPYWVLNGLVIESFNKSFVMSHLSGNTYSAILLSPDKGFHSIRYVANDSLNNINDTVIDSFEVIADEIPPVVTSVVINPVTMIGSVPYVKLGSTAFNITFNESMNTSIQPIVKYNSSDVSGNWADATHWIGYSLVNSTTSNGNYTLAISSARDLAGNLMIENTSTWFVIDSIPSKVASVALAPSVNNTYVKAGNISFTINFDKPMDQSVPLNVTFGQFSPYLQNVVSGGWWNSTSWIGYYYIKNSTLPGDGGYRLRIADGKDFIGNTMSVNTSFVFYVDTQTPVVRNPQAPAISYLQDQTIKVQAYDLGSGISSAVVQVGSINYTMQSAYNDWLITGYLTFAPIGNYYAIIPKASLIPNATNSYKFFVTDVSGNVNDSVTGSFYVNGTYTRTGGTIAYLCRNDPVAGTGGLQTCNYGIESQAIDWLRNNGWKVDVNKCSTWTATELEKRSLIVCSDQYYACIPTSEVTSAYNSGIGFVEISDLYGAAAGYGFNYVYNQYGSMKNGETDIFITAADSITAGYIGNATIYSASDKGIGNIRNEDLGSSVVNVADIGNTYSGYESSLFKVENSSAHGRYAWVGWFYSFYSSRWTPQDLNALGQELLKKTLNWAQCGNAMGCAAGP